MQQINKIQKSLVQAKEVVLATDDDREGEAISWHICKLFNLPTDTTKRIIFHEITKPAITKAINNPTNLNMNLINAQFGRQILDLIVGYKISLFYGSKFLELKIYLLVDVKLLPSDLYMTTKLKLIMLLEQNHIIQRDTLPIKIYHLYLIIITMMKKKWLNF